MYYSLVSYLTIRKEWFGALVSNPRTAEFYQFDSDALFLFNFLQKPITLEKIKEKSLNEGCEISDKDLQDFLDMLISQDIVTNDPNNHGYTIMYLDENTPENYLVAPSSVSIYITKYCGKSCIHCVTEAHSKIDQSKEYGLSEWKQILLKLKEIGVMSVVITGGEPLKKPDIFEILEFADSLDFRISILTDLDDIDTSTIDKLKSLKNLADLQTSLDGSNPKSHDFIRGNGSFLKTMNRLKLLSLSGIEYTISSSINSINIDEIDEIADISNKFGASYLYLNPVAPYGRAKETMKKYLLSNEQLFYLAHKYLEIIKTKGIDPGNSFWIKNLDKIGNKNFNPFENAFKAVSLGVYNFSIGQKGECYLDSKMKAEDVLCLGNAIKDDLLEMWNSEKLDFLRNAASKGENFFDITEI